MNWKKGILPLMVVSAISANANFTAIIGIEGTIAEKVGVIYKNISAWVNVGSTHTCSVWSPNVTTEPYGSTFEQTRDCSQNQERTKDEYTLYNSGAEVFEKTTTESQIIIVEEKQNAVGTENYVLNTTSTTGAWTNSGSRFNCGSWTPATSTVNSGQSFTQTRPCSQNQTQLTTNYDNWADGSQTVNSTSLTSRTTPSNETRTATGTKVTALYWRYNGYGKPNNTQATRNARCYSKNAQAYYRTSYTCSGSSAQSSAPGTCYNYYKLICAE